MKSLDRVETLISSEPSLNNTDLDDDDDEEEECEYDEEEDVDFNPFLKDTPSPEPSSSLSSEIETLDVEIVNSITVPQSLDAREAKQQSDPIPEDSQNNVEMKHSEEKEDEFDTVEASSADERTVEANENGEQLCDMIQTHKQDLLMSTEEDDAICKRTRARYSLAGFTLDDLEAFLQETDDEDDVPNVDDEEEYRKFLAAVLHSGDAEVQLEQSRNIDDDDDEDNDVDFEIELEEALETDDEETIPEKVTTTAENKSTKRRPVTRQKRRQTISIHHKNYSPEQAGRFLRPLLPILPTTPPRARRVSATGAVASSKDSTINGFTLAQMGELHSLIHDHLQLLIQVYSLCAFDHSRQHIGTQVQGLISEMLQRHQGYVSRPSHLLVTGSASSVLDMVDLAGRYLVDVSGAVQDYRRCQVESGFDASSQRVPLFSLPHQEVGREIINNPLSAPSSSKSRSRQQQFKKTLAATLVEAAQKQSVALVHKDIAKLAKRFLPLFKVSLFPHKPPMSAVASRVLFTDAEDELLALGIMEYNSDWKAIKQRFLPCKREHQIYVRQKNRRSSKAPENPIKAVLRMKSSPLTPQEIVRIQEGLNYFKYDWMSVWKFIVPYRDPSLLPRQWRTALGIQKSYKLDAVKKEKRRLYDTRRKSREQPASAKEDCHENHVGDELVESTGGAYLHEDFIGELRHGMPNLVYSTSIHSFDKAKDVPCDLHASVQTCTGEGSKNPELCGAQDLTCTRRLAQSFIPLYHHTSGTAPDASRASIIMRPYRARKLHSRSVVRLAPDLPPVNLPSSVRVISQSVFSKNQSDTSSKACIIKGGISDVSGRGNLGTETPCISAVGDNNDPPIEKVVDLQEDVPAESSSGMGDRNNDSNHQIHPFLLRTPKHGQITCYSSNRDPEGSGSFSFFPDNRPQLLSLFNSPREVNHSTDQFQKNSSSNEHETALGESCLHPFFRRTECETNYLILKRGNLDTDIGKKGELCQLQDRSGAFEKTSIPGAGCNDVSLKPFSSSKHGKKVNLDIYLSSSSSKVYDCGSVAAANISEVPDISMIHRNDGSEMPVSTAPSDDISRCIDEMADQSNLGIVMEQEELSDSDEEMMEEENVEFECEEMADSEGEEGSDCEEIIEMQDKDSRSSAVEIASTDVDSGKELGKDSPNSPWLSLEPSSRRLSGKVKDIEKTELANETTMAQYSSSRSRKKRTPMKSGDAETKEEAGVSRLRLGPLTLPSIKKPRKCVAQTELSPSNETT